MSGCLFDSNVLLDIATADPTWLPWSKAQLRRVIVSQGPILINPIIYAELAPAFATVNALDRWLDPAIFQRDPLPYAAGWLRAKAFVCYRRAAGAKIEALAINFHAEVAGWHIGLTLPSGSRRAAIATADPAHGRALTATRPPSAKAAASGRWSCRARFRNAGRRPFAARSPRRR